MQVHLENFQDLFQKINKFIKDNIVKKNSVMDLKFKMNNVKIQKQLQIVMFKKQTIFLFRKNIKLIYKKKNYISSFLMGAETVEERFSASGS